MLRIISSSIDSNQRVAHNRFVEQIGISTTPVWSPTFSIKTRNVPDLKFVDLMRPNKVIDDLDGTGPSKFSFRDPTPE